MMWLVLFMVRMFIIDTVVIHHHEKIFMRVSTVDRKNTHIIL